MIAKFAPNVNNKSNIFPPVRVLSVSEESTLVQGTLILTGSPQSVCSEGEEE